MGKLPLDRKELIARMADGEAFEFFFFWGHTPPKDSSVNRSCLSQWYDASFSIEGITYRTAEHWMMAEKARLFRDDEKRREILAAATPKEAKALGRQVRDFDAGIWAENCVEIVVRGNLAKFSQNTPLREFFADFRGP